MGQQFDEIVAREARGFLPVVKRLPVAIAEGRGSRVRDVEGREFVDLTAGWGVCAIGHCHPRLVAAIGEQAGRLMQTTNLFYTLPQLDLVEKLRAVAPAELTRSFFVSSGAEAMDGALKLAHRATGRTKFVSTMQSFHGRTLGALAIIGQEKHRAPYQRIVQEGCYVPFGDLDAARRAIDENTAAFVVEPVQGEGGVNVAPPGYLAGLRQLTRDAGALLVLDEIQTGIGRTGKWLALEWDSVVPDVVTLGKGLGGGFPVAAFLCTRGRREDGVARRPRRHLRGQPARLRRRERGARGDRGRRARRALRRSWASACSDRLRRFVAEHPDGASKVRGRGLLIGMELSDADAAATLLAPRARTRRAGERHGGQRAAALPGAEHPGRRSLAGARHGAGFGRWLSPVNRDSQRRRCEIVAP